MFLFDFPHVSVFIGSSSEGSGVNSHAGGMAKKDSSYCLSTTLVQNEIS